MNKNGFTLVELLVVVSIFLILIATAVPVYGNLQVRTQLNESVSQAIQAIRIAREQSRAGYNDSQHGVYFEMNVASKDRFILYQGESYATRNSDYDIITELDSSISIVNSSFLLTSGDIDINFSKNLALPNNTGSMALVHIVDGSAFITLNSLGMVELE